MRWSKRERRSRETSASAASGPCDFGLGTPKELQRQDLLEVIEDRDGRSSTIVTSQLETKKWHEWIGDPTTADAILDRLVHNAHELELAGPSGRKEKGTAKI